MICTISPEESRDFASVANDATVYIDVCDSPVCGKLESNNVPGSVQDRPALSMILAAEESGQLVPGSTVVEATSGNTFISFAMVCSVRGYRCVIVMLEDMSAA